MVNNNRPKMTVADRAKQFSPFAALSGLDAALAKMEKIVVPAKELSEESLQELDETMHKITRGTITDVIYYSKGEYIKISGMVAKIEQTSRILQIVNTRISFDDIVELKIHS